MINNIHEKILDSDWLRTCSAVQVSETPVVKLSVTQCSAKSVTHECKLCIVTLDYDWLKDNRKFSKPMISRKIMTIILCGNSEKNSLE